MFICLLRVFRPSKIGVAKCLILLCTLIVLVELLCCLTNVSLKDKILTWGSALTLSFMTSFSWGNSCFQTLAIRVVTGAWSQFTGNCPFHWPNYYVFCLDFLVVTTSVHFGRVEVDSSTCQTKTGGRAGWSELLTNLCAWRWHFYFAQSELMGTPRRSTSKHNLSQWFGVMPINVSFFCLLYEMCYFALSLLKNTFLKKIQIMWMFTVNGLVFFFFLLLRENNDLWAFRLR